MGTGATRNDVAVAALNVVEAYLRNPNTVVAPGDMVGLIEQVHDTAMRLGDRAEAQALAAPAPVPALPAPSRSGRRRHPLKDAKGRWDDEKVWPGVAPEMRERFAALVEQHNLHRDEATGIPQPRRPRHMLISEDTMTVADPFTGEYFAMLKRRLEVHYGLTHVDVLEMFDLTDQELPRLGPGYRESKSRAAIRNKLGHHKKGRGRQRQASAAA
jgi:predicted transcriptional regulator